MWLEMWLERHSLHHLRPLILEQLVMKKQKPPTQGAHQDPVASMLRLHELLLWYQHPTKPDHPPGLDQSWIQACTSETDSYAWQEAIIAWEIRSHFIASSWPPPAASVITGMAQRVMQLASKQHRLPLEQVPGPMTSSGTDEDTAASEVPIAAVEDGAKAPTAAEEVANQTCSDADHCSIPAASTGTALGNISQVDQGAADLTNLLKATEGQSHASLPAHVQDSPAGKLHRAILADRSPVRKDSMRRMEALSATNDLAKA